MWVMSRVTVLFPLVPLMLTIGVRRSVSRIQVGPAGDAVAIALVWRSRSRDCAPVSVARRAGETSRSASANAASAMARPRSTDAIGQVTIQCPGSEVRWTTSPAVPSRWSIRSRRTHAAMAATPSGHLAAGTAAPRRTRAWWAGSRWPYHVRRRPTATSSLTTGASR